MRTQAGRAGALAALPALALGGLATALWVSLLPRGVDFNDEAVALLAERDPWVTIPQGDYLVFAFVLHPLHSALGGDITLLRMVTWLVTATLTVIATVRALRVVGVARGAPLGPWVTATLVAAQLVWTPLSAVFLHSSPGYYSLLHQGLLVCVIGLTGSAGGRPWLTGALLGLGAFLMGCGRPQAGLLVLLLIMGGVTWVRGPGRARTMASMAVTLATLGIALLVGMGLTPAGLVDYLGKGAAYMLAVTDGNLTAGLGIGARFVVQSAMVPVIGVFALIAAGLALTCARSAALATRGAAVASVASALAAVTFCLALGSDTAFHSFGAKGLALGLLLPGIPGLMWLALARRGAAPSPAPTDRTRAATAVAALLVASPYLFTVGTTTFFTMTMGRMGGLAALGMVVPLLIRTPERLIAPLALANASVLASLGVILTFGGIVHSGTVVPPWVMTIPSRVGAGTLQVTPADAALLGDVRSAARHAGLTPSTDLVNLLGQDHLILYETGARPFPRLAFYAAFPGSLTATRDSLAGAECRRLARAMLLHDPHVKGELSKALTDLGVDLTEDYTVAATVRPGRSLVILRPKPIVAVRLGCR